MVRIGKAAGAAGLSIDTLRFYERSGLIKPPPRTAGGYRLYRDEDIDRLRFIHRAKELGFTLDEIAQLLRLNDGTGRRRDVRAIASRRLTELEQKIAELSRIRQALAHLVHHCDAEGSVAGCPIIEALIAPRQASELPRTPARRRRRINTNQED